MVDVLSLYAERHKCYRKRSPPQRAKRADYVSLTTCSLAWKPVKREGGYDCPELSVISQREVYHMGKGITGVSGTLYELPVTIRLFSDSQYCLRMCGKYFFKGVKAKWLGLYIWVLEVWNVRFVEEGDAECGKGCEAECLWEL